MTWLQQLFLSSNKEATENGQSSGGFIHVINPIKKDQMKSTECNNLKNCFETIIIFVTAVIFGLIGYNLRLFFKPTRRGFWCLDKSIRLPYHDSTIENSSVFLLAAPITLAVTIIGEFCNNIPPNIWKTLSRIAQFNSFWVMGIAINIFLVNVFKISLGNLRPNFIDVCRPVFNQIQWDTCDNNTQKDTYFPPTYKCTTTEDDDNDYRIIDAKMSFYSGHSSTSFFFAVYIIIYTQMRIASHLRTLYLPLFVLFYTGLISLAAVVAISRIYDNKHHPIDVCVGVIIGTVTVIAMVYFYKKEFLGKINLDDNTPASCSEIITEETAGKEEESFGIVKPKENADGLIGIESSRV